LKYTDKNNLILKLREHIDGEIKAICRHKAFGLLFCKQIQKIEKSLEYLTNGGQSVIRSRAANANDAMRCRLSTKCARSSQYPIIRNITIGIAHPHSSEIEAWLYLEDHDRRWGSYQAYPAARSGDT
jgi:hypothetical protein